MGRGRKIRRWVGMLVMCTLFLAPVEAAANGGDEVGVYMLIFYCEFVVIPAGIVSGIGNLYYVTKGEQASNGWKIAGFSSGALNILAGVAWLATDFENDSFPVGIGVTNIVIGTMDIGFTLWGSFQPEKKEQKLTLTPMIMSDVRGRLAVGVGLRLVDW